MRSRFRIESAAAVRADAVGEVGSGVFPDVVFQDMPIALPVADFMTGSADGQQSAEGLDPRQSLLQLLDQPFALRLGSFARTDVANDQAGSRIAFGTCKNYGRKFDRKQRSIGAPRDEFAVSSSRLLSFGDIGLKARIGVIDEASTALLQNPLARAAQNSARGRIRVENPAIRCRQHDAVEAVVKQHPVERFFWKIVLLS